MMHHIRLIGAAAVGCFCLPTLCDAQPAANAPRVGLLAWSDCDAPDLRAGLTDVGRVPGRTIVLECRSAGGRYEGLLPAAAELLALPVDVIVTESQPAAHAAREATRVVPIVTILSGDPVGAGLAKSLARPGGNVTGVTYYATELTGKRLDLLLEMIPGLARIGILTNPHVSYLPFEEDAKRAAARSGLAVVVASVTDASELESAFRQMKQAGAQAVLLIPDLMAAYQAKRIGELARTERLPLMAWGSWFTEAGGLMAYSADYGPLIRRLAGHVDKVLKGVPVGEVPIEQPAHFELTINASTARELGISVPPALLARADRVIETDNPF